jgi:predicted nucleic acid-binding protein
LRFLLDTNACIATSPSTTPALPSTGRLSPELDALGRPIGPSDLLIGATARAHLLQKG